MAGWNQALLCRNRVPLLVPKLCPNPQPNVLICEGSGQKKNHAFSKGGDRKSSEISMRIKLAMLFGCSLLFSCAVRLPVTRDDAVAAVARALSADSILSLSGNGTLEVFRNGERYSASFDIAWNGDSSFSLGIFGPLGVPIAAMKSIAGSRLQVWIGDSQFVLLPLQPIRLGTLIPELPFGWQNLIRIITLHYPCISVCATPPDTLFTDKKTQLLVWRGRQFDGQSLSISISLENKTNRLTEIRYGFDDKEIPRIEFGDFHRRQAGEIRFVTSDNNYFYVTYRKLTVNPRKVQKP